MNRERQLIWKPIEDAPEGQVVLIWSSGDFNKGYVHHVGNGGYEVNSIGGMAIFGATHYALVEGP